MTQRIPRQPALIAVGLTLLCGGQIAMFRNPENTTVVVQWLAMGAGLLLFFVGAAPLLRSLPDEDTPRATSDTITTPRLRPILWGVGVGLLVVTTARALVSGVGYWEQLLTWVGGIAALVLAARDEGRPTLLLSRDVWIAGGLVGLALIARLAGLAQVPPLLDQDESSFLMEGIRIAQKGFGLSPFHLGFHNYPLLYQGLLGASQAIFGQNFIGARIVPAVFGALSVGATYLLGRELFNRRVGMFAALFMLAWPLHFLFSRLALNQPGDLTFTALAAFWLARGLRRGSGRDFVLAGIMAGIGQLFYIGGRIVVPVLIVWLIFIGLRDRGLIRQQWRGLALMFGAFVMTALPQHFYLLTTGQSFTTRLSVNVLVTREEYIVQGRITTLWEQVYRSFGGLFTVPDLLWYGRSSNLMLFTGGVLLVIGVVVALMRLWRNPRYALPLGWAFAVILIGTTFSTNPPQYQRVFSGAVLLALLAGTGGVALADVIALALRRAAERRELAYGLGLLVAAINLAFLVLVYIPEAGYFAIRATHVTNQLGWMMNTALDEGRQVVVVRNPLPRNAAELETLRRMNELQLSDGVGYTEVVQFLTRSRPVTVINDPLRADTLLADYAKPFAVFVPVIYVETMQQIAQQHPQAELHIVQMQSGDSPAFVVFRSK